MVTHSNHQSSCSPWPHRWAWVLCLATFPLIWVGGLITTTDAGMAVPDWPGTYGYNLFLYPWQTWLFGPWDLLVEHGHRLFASGVGLLTIGFVIVVWRNSRNALLRKLALAALALVIFQGVLGGLRVVLNERLLAMLHGSTGPLFFGLTAALVALTSRESLAASQTVGGVSDADDGMPATLAQKSESASETPPTTSQQRSVSWVWVLPVCAYFQLVAGAALRHVPEDSSFNTFAVHVQAHLWGALVVTIAVITTAWMAWRKPVGRSRKWLATLLVGVLALQVTLGVATWVAKYRLPDWAQQTLARRGLAADAWETAVGAGTIPASTAGGWGQTHTVTGHSANGSLLLGLSIAHAVVARRRLPSGSKTDREKRPQLSLLRPAESPALAVSPP